MKKPFAIIASILLLTSFSTYADIYENDTDKPDKYKPERNSVDKNSDKKKTGKQTSKKKHKSLENLLAEKGLKQGEIAKRIRTYNIDTWRRLNDRNILIESKGRNKDFLITFRNKCHRTRHQSTLIYKTTNNELTKFDAIGVLDNFMSSQDVLRPSYNCSIKEIYYLEKIEDETSAKDSKDSGDEGKKKDDHKKSK